jgi:glycine/D-amino acid oxidase-like deaminating enzyme
VTDHASSAQSAAEAGAAGPGPLLPAAGELSAPLPASTDVAIVGGGLAGCALAYYLARSGVEVTVIERGELNREASGTNAGSFHFQIAIHQLTGSDSEADRARLLADVRLHAAAADVWSELEGELCTDLGVHVTGGLMIAETRRELEILIRKQRIEQEAGLATELLTGPALAGFAPYLASDLSGAVYCGREGHANPLLAAPAFAVRAMAAGARFRTHAPVHAVESLDGPGASRFRLRTGAGDLLAARLVNAAGAWAPEVAALSGLPLPVYSDGLHVNVTEPRERMLTPMLQHIGRRLTLKQAANGTFIIGGGWPAQPEQPPARYSVRWDSAAGNTAVALRVMPALRDVRIMHMWTGVIAFTDDLLPVVGEYRRLPGYYLCLASTGFTLGPIIARMLAEHLASPGLHRMPAEYAPDRVPALARG